MTNTNDTELLAPYVDRPTTGPRADDVVSIDAIITAVYDTISGPAGPKDWDRERHLYAPGAILCSMKVRDGAITAEHMDVESFCASRGKLLGEIDFVEREIGRTVERYGNIAHAWSAYEAIGGPPGGPHAPMFRGANSIQLLWNGERWWITAVIWDQEREENPLPEHLLAAIESGADDH